MIIGWAGTAVAIVWALLERASAAKHRALADKAHGEADTWRRHNEQLGETIQELGATQRAERASYLGAVARQAELVASCQATVSDAILAAGEGGNSAVLQRIASAAIQRLHEVSIAQTSTGNRAGDPVPASDAADRAVTQPGGGGE